MPDIRQVLFDIHKEIIDDEWGPYDDDHYWPMAGEALARLGLSELLVQYTYWLKQRGVLPDGLTYADLATEFARERNLP